MYEYSLSANSASIFAQACCTIHSGAQRPGLFVRLGEQNDVAIEHDFAPVQVHHHGQFGGEQLLVVLGAAAVDVAVLFDGRQRIHRPLRAIGGHHIAVRDQQQRALLARAAQARHEVEALRDRRRAVPRECPRGRPPASGIARRASRCPEDWWCPAGSTPAGSAPPDRPPFHPAVPDAIAAHASAAQTRRFMLPNVALWGRRIAFMRISERTACDSNRPTTRTPHWSDCGCFARRQIDRHRRHARDRQQHADAEFARAPGGEVCVRGTAASARDGTADWAERKPCNARQLMRPRRGGRVVLNLTK